MGGVMTEVMNRHVELCRHMGSSKKEQRCPITHLRISTRPPTLRDDRLATRETVEVALATCHLFLRQHVTFEGGGTPADPRGAPRRPEVERWGLEVDVAQQVSRNHDPV